jgi:hypothetical protein
LCVERCYVDCHRSFSSPGAGVVGLVPGWRARRARRSAASIPAACDAQRIPNQSVYTGRGRRRRARSGPRAVCVWSVFILTATDLIALLGLASAGLVPGWRARRWSVSIPAACNTCNAQHIPNTSVNTGRGRRRRVGSGQRRSHDLLKTPKKVNKSASGRCRTRDQTVQTRNPSPGKLLDSTSV